MGVPEESAEAREARLERLYHEQRRQRDGLAAQVLAVRGLRDETALTPWEDLPRLQEWVRSVISVFPDPAAEVEISKGWQGVYLSDPLTDEHPTVDELPYFGPSWKVKERYILCGDYLYGLTRPGGRVVCRWYAPGLEEWVLCLMRDLGFPLIPPLGYRDLVPPRPRWKFWSRSS